MVQRTLPLIDCFRRTEFNSNLLATFFLFCSHRGGKLLNPFPGIGTAMFLLNIRKKAQTLDGNRPRVALHSHRLLYICQRAVLGIYKSCTHNFTFIRTISYKGIKIMNCATIHLKKIQALTSSKWQTPSKYTLLCWIKQEWMIFFFIFCSLASSFDKISLSLQTKK